MNEIEKTEGDEVVAQAPASEMDARWIFNRLLSKLGADQRDQSDEVVELCDLLASRVRFADTLGWLKEGICCSVCGARISGQEPREGTSMITGSDLVVTGPIQFEFEGDNGPNGLYISAPIELIFCKNGGWMHKDCADSEEGCADCDGTMDDIACHRATPKEELERCEKCGSELTDVKSQIKGFGSWLVCKKAMEELFAYLNSDEGDQEESVISIKDRMMKGHYYEHKEE